MLFVRWKYAPTLEYPTELKAMSRIFVLSRNSSAEVTAAMSDCIELLRRASGHTNDCGELARAAIGIDTDTHLALAAAMFRKSIPAETFDAEVIGCFSGPGLAETCATSRFRVFGIVESEYCSALLLGQRFGVISLGSSSTARHARQIQAL